MNLTLLTAAISAALAGAAGFSAAWTIQGRNIDSLKLEQRDAIISQQRAARATSERLAQQVITAQNAAAARNVTLAADRSRAVSELDRVRESIAIAMRSARDSHDACIAKADACGVVFSQCAGRLVEVAADTDQCFSDNKALTDGWPR